MIGVAAQRAVASSVAITTRQTGVADEDRVARKDAAGELGGAASGLRQPPRSSASRDGG